ncbi:reverse transcriptase domain-containing protein, partial [Tanacetum coccineum]
TLEFPRNTYFNPIPPNTNFNYDSKDTELDEEAGYTINEESVMSEHEAINPVHTVNTQYFEEELSSEEDLDEWLNAKMEKHITNIDASNNVMPRSINEYMKLANLGGAAMSVEMDDMTQQETLETMKNVLVKINKFEFPCDFVVTNMPKNLREMIILGRPFLETIYAQIDVF